MPKEVEIRLSCAGIDIGLYSDSVYGFRLFLVTCFAFRECFTS